MKEIKKCLCAAHNYDECCCGAWDDLDPYTLKDEIKDLKEQVKRMQCKENCANASHTSYTDSNLVYPSSCNLMIFPECYNPNCKTCNDWRERK